MDYEKMWKKLKEDLMKELDEYYTRYETNTLKEVLSLMKCAELLELRLSKE